MSNGDQTWLRLQWGLVPLGVTQVGEPGEGGWAVGLAISLGNCH